MNNFEVRSFKKLLCLSKLMQNLNPKLELTTKSLTSFYEILSEPSSPIIRDATLLRFQYSVEIFWRLMKDYLCVHEGFVCESPKSCIKMTFKVGLMDEEETMQALDMIDKNEEIRHVTDHVNFEGARKTYPAEVRGQKNWHIRIFCARRGKGR